MPNNANNNNNDSTLYQEKMTEKMSEIVPDCIFTDCITTKYNSFKLNTVTKQSPLYRFGPHSHELIDVFDNPEHTTYTYKTLANSYTHTRHSTATFTI